MSPDVEEANRQMANELDFTDLKEVEEEVPEPEPAREPRMLGPRKYMAI